VGLEGLLHVIKLGAKLRDFGDLLVRLEMADELVDGLKCRETGIRPEKRILPTNAQLR
jgi:hypothetical protein